MRLMQALEQLGVTLDDNRDVIPISEFPAIAEQLGLTLIFYGQSCYLHKDTPVVAVIETSNGEVIQYAPLCNLTAGNIVCLFFKTKF
jgi:hypothetical protein